MRLHVLASSALLFASAGATSIPLQQSIQSPPNSTGISHELFDELSELARIVDIAYCVGTLSTGIEPPFQCLSWCSEFPEFELVQTWNTGFALSDSCGYIALSHAPAVPRILIAFRGTYSITNALVDLSASHQEYLPYPSDGHSTNSDKCDNCTVHRGFLQSWSQTEKIIGVIVEDLVRKYPGYQVTLVGHSLGGAVAALAGLDFQGRGWNPTVTTFGEPKVGNKALAEFFNKKFTAEKYRRVTHIEDPVPLVPTTSMGYTQHAYEIYVDREDVPFEVGDVRRCEGNEDPDCAAGSGLNILHSIMAHRDYFHRIGICLPPENFLHKFDSGELKKREVEIESPMV